MASSPGGVLRVRVSGSPADVWRFLREHPLEAQEVDIRESQMRLDLTVDDKQRDLLQQYRLRIESALDVHANLLERRKQVEPADRFNERRIPAGIGRLLK
jgi:hypothetical protein